MRMKERKMLDRQKIVDLLWENVTRAKKLKKTNNLKRIKRNGLQTERRKLC